MRSPIKNSCLFAALILFSASAAFARPPQAPQSDQQDQPPPASQTPQPQQGDSAPTKPEPQPATKPPADDSSQWSSSKKPDVDPDPDSDNHAKAAPAPTVAPGTKGAKAGVLPPETDPAWDPFHAEQDVEVGMFYMHKGDVDAAISRFEDAIRLRDNFAKPRLLLAEAYEKKGDKDDALRYYQEYLKVLPNAADAKKVQSKIDKLSKK